MAQNTPYKARDDVMSEADDGGISVEIPAKVILFGEHAVVYPGNQAVLWPVRSLRTRVDARVTSSTNNYTVAGTDSLIEFNELGSVLEEARFAYGVFETNGHIESLQPYKDPQLYIRFCIALAHEHVRTLKKPKSLHVVIDSNIPVGGFGSSAAVAAGIIKAVVSANDIVLDQKAWFQLVMEAEKLQHGNPSGGDPAVATMRTPVIVAKKPDGSIDIEQIDETPKIQELVQNTKLIYTGRPEQSTGEVVQYVSSKEGNGRILAQVEDNTKDAIKSIKKNQLTLKKWRRLINTNGELLEQLGVVPEEFKQLSGKVRAGSGSIKISGGGATKGHSCGVMVYSGDTELEELSYDIYNLV